MAEIKIKIDSSDIDAAIAKVSHLLELVERLPAGLLGTESEAATAESVKVFINEAFINKNDIKSASIGAAIEIENAIANSNEFEKLKASKQCAGSECKDPYCGGYGFSGYAEDSGFNICGVGPLFFTDNPPLPPYGDHINFSECSSVSEAMNMAKRADKIKKSEKIDSPTCDTLAIYHCVRDALHRFEAKLDGMKDEPAANSAALTEKIRDSITNAVSVGGGASAHQAIRNR